MLQVMQGGYVALPLIPPLKYLPVFSLYSLRNSCFYCASLPLISLHSPFILLSLPFNLPFNLQSLFILPLISLRLPVISLHSPFHLLLICAGAGGGSDDPCGELERSSRVAAD